MAKLACLEGMFSSLLGLFRDSCMCGIYVFRVHEGTTDESHQDTKILVCRPESVRYFTVCSSHTKHWLSGERDCFAPQSNLASHQRFSFPVSPYFTCPLSSPAWPHGDPLGSNEPRCSMGFNSFVIAVHLLGKLSSCDNLILSLRVTVHCLLLKEPCLKFYSKHWFPSGTFFF